MSELDHLGTGMIDPTRIGQNQQIQASTHGMYCNFYMEAEQDLVKSLEEGRPIFKESPYVMIMTPGDQSSVVRRPIRTGHHPKDDNNRFAVEYNAFLNNMEQPIEGTLLSEWPQISKSQCLELDALHIKTVEQLANLNDGAASQYMGMQDLKSRAKAWIELASAEAPLAFMTAQLEERDDAIASMKNTMLEMQAELGDLKGAPKRKVKKED